MPDLLEEAKRLSKDQNWQAAEDYRAHQLLAELVERLEQERAERKRLRETLRQIMMGEPEPDASDVEAGVYPMLNRTHEVHLYQRIAERALAAQQREVEGG